MKHFSSGGDLAREMGVSPSTLGSTFATYNEIAKTGKCPFGKKFFHNAPFEMNDNYHVA